MFWQNKLVTLSTQLKQLKMKILQTLRQNDGSVLIFTAIAMPLLLAFLGFSFDAGNLYMHKARLQNISDAAALAGARAFVDSLDNPDTDLRDSIDTTTISKSEKTYTIDDEPKKQERNTVHPKADTAADDYIYKNIINLSNKIYSDHYSHFALLSAETNPRIFYRVGLYEYVNLNFLPIIRGFRKRQKVSVHSIVLLDEDTGTQLPSTIFDNLFMFSEKLNAVSGTVTAGSLDVKESAGGASIKTTFDGQMIYTGTDTSGYYTIADAAHLYTSDGKNAQTSQDLPVSGIGPGYINDPLQSGTSISLSDYLAILNTKLNSAHIELDMTKPEDRAKFTVDNINDLDSSLYSQRQVNQDGNDLYTITIATAYSTESFVYAIDPAYQNDYDSAYRYYSFDSNNQKIYWIPLPDDPATRVLSYEGAEAFDDDQGRHYNGNYVLDANDNKIYYTVIDVIDGGTVVRNVYFANETHTPINATKKAENHFTYKDANNNDVVILYTEIPDDTLKNNTNKVILQIDTNVFYIAASEDAILINIDKEITGAGKASEPVYIINGTSQEMQINVTDDNVRPLVVIQNGTVHVNITVSEGKTFNGLIYSSGDVNVTLNSGSFCGGISGKNISVENTGDGASSFTQTNYLQSDAEIYNKISKYAFEHGQLSGEVSTTNPPSYTYTNSWQEWYTLVGPEAAANWFSNLSESRKLAFWRSWDDANRPLNSGLWDWWYNGKWKEDWFFADWNPTEQQISDAKNDEPVEIIPNYKLRLVNPRLEANPFTKTSS